MSPRRWISFAGLIPWLFSRIRFGTKIQPTWRNYHQMGSSDFRTAVLFVTGLSANGPSSSKSFSRTIHRNWPEAHVWSRLLSGHTGLYDDFVRSRFWHWIHDACESLKKLVHQHGKREIVLIGHSTGGLVVLAVAMLAVLKRSMLRVENGEVKLRLVLICPPFSLHSKRDTLLLWVVALLYYLISPAAFVLLALSGEWMWPLALLGVCCHWLLVPQIWVPNGEQRSSTSDRSRRWVDFPEGILLALACLFFVTAPPLLAIYARLSPGAWSQGMFALFILTLLIPLFLIRRVTATGDHEPNSGGTCYRWLPVITAANLLLLQFLLKRFLSLVRCPVLILEGELDIIAKVDKEWLRRMKSAQVVHLLLPGFKHSELSTEQQEQMAKIVIDWCQQGRTQCLAKSKS